MSLIKVRESKEPIKSHRQGSIITTHAKNAYIRTKAQGQRAMDDSESTPTEYASDNAQYMMEEAVQDAGLAVESGIKAAIHKRRTEYQKHKHHAVEHGGTDPAPPSDDMAHGDLPINHTPPLNGHNNVQPGGHEYNPMQSKEALEKAKVAYQAKQWTTRKDRVNQALQTEHNTVNAVIAKQADLLHTADSFSNPATPKQAGITVYEEHRPGQKTASKVSVNSNSV